MICIIEIKIKRILFVCLFPVFFFIWFDKSEKKVLKTMILAQQQNCIQLIKKTNRNKNKIHWIQQEKYQEDFFLFKKLIRKKIDWRLQIERRLDGIMKKWRRRKICFDSNQIKSNWWWLWMIDLDENLEKWKWKIFLIIIIIIDW